MLKYPIIYMLLLLNFIQINCLAQNIDSLKLELKKAKSDTSRCNLLFELSESASDEEWPIFNEQLLTLSQNNLRTTTDVHLRKFFLTHLAHAHNNKGVIAKQNGEDAAALQFFKEALRYSIEIKDHAGMSSAYFNIGSVYSDQDNNALALENLLKALSIQKSIKDYSGIAGTLTNIGSIYNHQGDVTKALDYYHQSLKIEEQLGDQLGISISLNNIGNLYNQQGDYDKCLEYYQRSLTIEKKLNYKAGMANSLHNMSTLYLVLNKYALAIETCNESLKLYEELKDKKGIAVSLINLGNAFKYQGLTREALPYFYQSLKIVEEINYKEGIAFSLGYISDALLVLGQLDKAAAYAKRNLILSQELHYVENIKGAAYELKKIYKKQNNFKAALEMYELEVKMTDSLSNESTRKASMKTQLKYEYEKRAAADSVKNAEEQKVKDAQLTAQNASLKSEKTQRYALYGGLVLVVGFLIFIFNRFRVTQQQKKIIEAQKHLVDEAFEKLAEKNKEVIDSITYARRIQRALITSEKYITRKLNELK